MDERGTVLALDAARLVFRRHIEAYGGRVIDMAGDSVLAVFELCSTAMSAALAIQDELQAGGTQVPEERRLRFRIGVHLGEIIEKRDGTVYGDGVNIAARLQSLERVLLASIGTDGSDGPTDAAGAWVDGQTMARAHAQGVRPDAYLASNDSYRFFEQVGGLVHTGPTLTNVNDLFVLLAL